MSILIARHVEGITLNELEYAKNSKGELFKFETEQKAKDFLKSIGVLEEHVDNFIYKDISNEEL